MPHLHQGFSVAVRTAHPVVALDEICAATINVSARREVLLDLFYHCRNVLSTRIPSLIGLFREEDFPPLIMRDSRGLSWDTPAGFKLSKVMPAVMWKMGIFNIWL